MFTGLADAKVAHWLCPHPRRVREWVCTSACARVRVRECMCVRVSEAEVARLFPSDLCGSVYAQAEEAVLIIGFCCAKSLRIGAVPPGASLVGEACQ